MESKISFYKNISEKVSTEKMPLSIFLYNVKNGKWEKLAQEIRKISDHNQRQEKKREIMPHVTISGYFQESRKVENLTLHSNFIGMDIDDIETEIESTRALLSTDPYIYAIFKSVSNTGLCAIFRIDGERHKDAFDAIADYLKNKYQIIVDPSGKDVSRARYVSYDPDLHLNEKAAIFKKYLPKPKKLKITNTIFVQTEFDEVISQMVKKQVNCVEDYRDWLSIGFGLADKFGEQGRHYFHALSQISSKYEKSMCDKQYTHCVKHRTNTSKVTIATIYYHAKQAGINIYTEKTRKIAAVTSSQKKAGLSATQIADNLEKFEGIPKQDADDIIRQAFQSNGDVKTGESIVDQVRAYLRHQYQLKRNVITRKIENNGKILDEIELNTMFLDCKNIFTELSSEIFMKIVFSNNTPSYNPLLEWFEENTGQPVGVIDEFFSCFDTPDDIKYFGKKWLVGVISAIHGIHSPLMLILAGEKQGTGKTEAFRRMLPKALIPYYAESKLDAGKDDEILMTQKLIIMDDEMGGKSKKESKRLKELTSKQTFTLREPYGKMNVDLDRLAVLCGTTNDLQILNDPTGNRRLLPMQIFGIDHKRYNAINKDDLFIEAYNLWQSGFEWQLTTEDVERMAKKNDKFEEYSVEYDLINKYYQLPESSWFVELTATDIKVSLEAKSSQKLSLRKIGFELKRLGYECEIKKINRTTQQLYKVSEKVENTYKPYPF